MAFLPGRAMGSHGPQNFGCPRLAPLLKKCVAYKVYLLKVSYCVSYVRIFNLNSSIVLLSLFDEGKIMKYDRCLVIVFFKYIICI